MAVRAERLASVDQDVESDADDENPGPSTSKKQKMSAKSVGAAKYRTKFQKEWLKVYPFVQEVKDNPHKFLCNICMRQVACDHQGKHDIERHMEKAMHQANVKQMKGQTTLGFQVESSPINEQVIRAEVKVAHMLAQHNVPLSLADELTPLFHDIFPDSDIAKNFSSRRTKTACILNGAIAPVLQQNLVNTMKTCPFTLAIDGSTDTGVEKMNPLTVRIFNAEYAMNYALKNLPINDPMLINATFVNYDTKDDATFSQVEYFVQRFGELLPFTPARELELLQEEFTDYQLLMHDAIPSDVWNKAVTDEDEHTTYHRMDIVWHHLSSLKAPDGNPRFNRLSKIAKVVLVIPHSNAQEERIFSMNTLGYYNMTLDNIDFFIGDNCSTNKRCATLAKKPMIGCHAHRLHLATKSAMAPVEQYLVKLDVLVSKLRTTKYSAKLRKRTALVPVARQETRWTSTQEMVSRYFKIKHFIEEIATGDEVLTELLLTPAANFAVKASFDDVMSSIRECTKLLQRRNQPLNLADVRTLFDAIIVKHDIFSGSQIDSTHSIVHSPDFENEIVKIINNEEVSMTSSEKKACKMFRIEEEPVAALVDVNMAGKIDFTALLKKRKLDITKKATNIDLNFIPTGSVDVESLFSTAKYIATDHRAHLLPITLEVLMILKHNRRFWSLHEIHEALIMPPAFDLVECLNQRMNYSIPARENVMLLRLKSGVFKSVNLMRYHVCKINMKFVWHLAIACSNYTFESEIGFDLEGVFSFELRHAQLVGVR
ncbi:hypothetical protein EMCRGX_G029970 [Ephydatia muelleri]